MKGEIYVRKNAWEKYNDEQIKEIMDFNEGYKAFITKGKTERLCVNETVKKRWQLVIKS